MTKEDIATTDGLRDGREDSVLGYISVLDAFMPLDLRQLCLAFIWKALSQGGESRFWLSYRQMDCEHCLILATLLVNYCVLQL